MCHAMQATQKNEARKKNWFPMASRKQRSAAVCFEISLRRQRVCSRDCDCTRPGQSNAPGLTERR